MKFLFLSSDKTSLATADDVIIQGVRNALLAKPGCEEVTTPAAADAIVLEETFSFKEWRYISKLLADPIVGRYPHKVYTINRDDAANGLLKGLYTSLLKERRHVGLHRAVHYSYWPNRGILTAGNAPRPAPRYLGTWSGNIKSNPVLRGRMVAKCRRDSQFLIEPTDSWLNHRPDEQQQFVDSIRSSKFSLCPAGWSAASFRIYESMALGVCPVIIADSFIPPAGLNWADCSLQVRERDVSRLREILLREEHTWEERGLRAREAWLRLFSPRVSMDYYADQLLVCVRANLGSGSREKEIARWQSFRTHWLNQWTVPQRLRAMLRKQIQSGSRGVSRLISPRSRQASPKS
ncbi:MAG TPA: exostosin family protein [Opitutus sp.]|nr:exostosin family protein [Opitutus sp.]